MFMLHAFDSLINMLHIVTSRQLYEKGETAQS